jgi:hypothetical protein
METDMKTSIFNMTFTLPPLVEMTEVVKEMPCSTAVLKDARGNC